MAVFLVDIKFRERARHLLTSKEIYFCIIFLFFALINWSDVVKFFTNFGENGENNQFGPLPNNLMEEEAPNCNPKFKNMC